MAIFQFGPIIKSKREDIQVPHIAEAIQYRAVRLGNQG